MIELKETIFVNRPVEDVFKFTANFEYIEQWDPGVVSSVKLSLGPVQAGTVYDLALRYGIFAVKMKYTIVEYEPPARVVLKGTGKSFTVTDTILFSQTGTGTRIDYTAHFDFQALNASLKPLMKLFLGHMGKKAVDGLQRALTHELRLSKDVHRFRSGVKALDYLADRAILPGMLGFSKWGYWLSSRFWKANPNFLTGKTVVLTGATSGIGKAAAFALADLDAHLVLVARDHRKAVAVQREIIRQTGNRNIEFYLADLSLMSDIKKLARDLEREKAAVDILINSAGALFGTRMETGEGFEKTFATDLLGVYFLTDLLLGLLAEANHPRIINVSSGGMYTRKIDINDLQSIRNPYDGAGAYARAKRGVNILTELWAKSLAQKGFHVHAMHPGWVDTPGLALSLPRFYALTRSILRTPRQGADTIAWLASAMEPGLCTGRFWLDRRPHETHVFPGTRESERERNLFLQKLDQLTRRFR